MLSRLLVQTLALAMHREKSDVDSYLNMLVYVDRQVCK